jgi:hypothetical protein
MAALGAEDTSYAVPGKAIGQRYAGLAARNKSGRARLRACDIGHGHRGSGIGDDALSKKYT